MGSNQAVRRYRINPVELLIFIGVCSGFGYSVMNLFNQTENFKMAALQPMTSQPNRNLIAPSGEADRQPAAQAPGLVVEIPCTENPSFNQNCTPQGRELPMSPRYNPADIR